LLLSLGGQVGDTCLTRARLGPGILPPARGRRPRPRRGLRRSGGECALAGLFALLRGLGFLAVEPSPGDLLVPVPPEVARAGAAVDRALMTVGGA
jgi:hypothetical protein